MKKYVLYIVITLLLVVIAIGGTYIFMSNKNNTNNDVNSDNKVKEPINNKDNTNNNNNNQEKITLSDSELKNYLSYIPYNHSLLCVSNDGNCEQFSAYRGLYSINNVDKRVLAASALLDVFDVNNIEEITFNDAKILIKKMYNYNIDKPQGKEEPYAMVGCTSLNYNNDKFSLHTGCGLIESLITEVSDYEVTDNNLIIYEYAIVVGDEAFYDIQKQTIINIEQSLCSYETEDGYYECLKVYGDYAKNYLKEHKTEFTKYKHTFKKNETGYYWYSTEVA